MEPTFACGVFGLGVNPGEGNGEPLIPGLTDVVLTGWVGKPLPLPPIVSVVEAVNGPHRVSRVHCKNSGGKQLNYRHYLW